MGVRVMLLVLLVIGALVIVGLVGSEYYTSQPQFCNSCHTMNRYYDTWKKSKHGEKDVACVDCHYAPGEKIKPKSKFKGLKHVATYFTLSERGRKAQVFVPTKVPDVSCLSSECHPKEKFLDKQLKFIEKIPFVHKTHEEKTIEGQKLHCNTCHMHRSADEHFDVPKEACFLCHFKNITFNEGRSKCSLCHEIPTKEIKKGEGGPDGKPITHPTIETSTLCNDCHSDPSRGKPITHQTIEKANVPCLSCHFELVLGTGSMKEKECLHCHEKGEVLDALKEENKKEIMHAAHVTEQNAKCFDCHDYIEHKERPHFETALQNCKTCHAEPHIYQQLLIAGTGGKGIERSFPIAHYDVKVNCLACHTKEGFDEKGRRVKRAEVKACVECHLKDEEKLNLPKQWQTDILAELKNAREAEKSAIEAVKNAKGKVPDKVLIKAMAALNDGQENLKIVDAGGGVHNKKYSMLLIETAVEKFEEVIEELKK